MENNEHKNFYVENLVPNQGKNHDLPPVGFFTLHYHGQIGYKVTHLVTSNSLDLAKINPTRKPDPNPPENSGF